MSIVSIQAASGSYLGVDEAAKLVGTGTQQQLFALVALEGEQVALMPMAFPGCYLHLDEARRGGVVASSGTIGETARFTRVEARGKTTFRALNGRFLGQDASGVLCVDSNVAGDGEHFKVIHHEASVLRGGHCCGRRRSVVSEVEEDEPLWDDETHKRILLKALDLMGFHQHILEIAHVTGTLNNPHVRDYIWKGLHDADYLSPYTGLDYSPHFYDPDIGRNFRHPWPWANPNACTEGTRFFNIATATFANVLWKVDNRIDVDESDYNASGYLLGIACHYLTDLTQPMHAANFANLVGQRWPAANPFDWRHSNFEGNAEKQVKAGYLNDAPRLTDAMLGIPAEAGPSDLLIETARQAKEVFDQHLEPIARKKLVLVQGVIPIWRTVPFTDAEVRGTLDLTLKGPALRAAARFLQLWWRKSDQQRKGIDCSRWYRVGESTQGQQIRRDGKWIRRWKAEADSDDFLHAFHRNRDGSYLIVCKAQQDSVWTLSDVAAGMHCVELKAPLANSEKQRFLPVPDETKLWIYTLDRHEALRVREAPAIVGWDGHLVRWTPDITKPHLFELHDAGALTAAERQTITELGARAGG